MIKTRRAGHELVMRLATLVLALVVACGDPREHVEREQAAVEVSGERELVTTPLGPASGSQRAVSLLVVPEGYLATWRDSRERFGVEFEPFQSVQLERGFTARIGADGTVIDPTGAPLPAVEEFRGRSTKAACDDAGTCLLLDFGLGGIVGVRVAAGQASAAVPIDLGIDTGVPPVAWDGGAFRVVWGQGANLPMRSAQVFADGSIGPIVELASGGGPMAIACEGPRCLVTYTTRDSNFTERWFAQVFSPSGPEAPQQIAVGQHAWSGVHWDGARYWFALTSANSALRVFRIDPGGAVLGESTVATASTAGRGFPFLGHDGTTAIVAWPVIDSPLSNRLARITNAGTVLEPGGVELAPFEGSITEFVCRPGQCFALWTTRGEETVRGVRTIGVTPLDATPIAVATSPPGQADPAIAFGSGRYLTVWIDSQSFAPDTTIKGALFAPGAPATPVEIAPVQTAAPFVRCFGALDPAVAASASSYAVVWSEVCTSMRSYLQIFDAGGQPTTTAIEIDGVDPKVASDGSSYFVVWTDRDGKDIRAAVYATDGTLLLAPVLVATNGMFAEVAYDGASRYLVAYWKRPGDFVSTLFVRKVTAAGVLAPQLTLGTTTLTNQQNGRVDGHSIACSAGTCITTWLRNRDDVVAVRVLPAGTLAGSTLLGTASGDSRAASVAFDGQSFVVAWNTTTAVHGARLALDGTVIESDFIMATPPSPPMHPVIASDGAGSASLVYDRYDFDPAFRARRVRVRDVSDAPTTPPDAGVDAAVPSPDAASPDAPVLPDAGVDAAPDASPDAGVDAAPDAASPDAPPDAPDAPVADASVEPDAPPMGGGGGGGCGGCNTSGGDGWLCVALIAILGRARRRNTRRRTPI